MVSVLLFAAALAFTPADARVAYDQARELVEKCTPRDAGTIRGRIAANCILDGASAAGADVHRDVFTVDTPEGRKEMTNLYAPFRYGDSNARWVVLVSHYDTKWGVKCPGANDGASTSGLLVGIANAFSAWEEPKGNLLLVWTDGEECMRSYAANDGLWGSRRAVEFIRSNHYEVQAVICTDMLGDRDLSISIPANGSPALTRIAMHSARRAGYPKLVKPIAEYVKDDHLAFIDAGYKAIVMIDFSYGPNNAYWHTPQDSIDKISEASLLKSGKVIVEMLNILL